MLADTAAIGDFGAAQARHATDLDAIGARLTAAAALLTSDGLGPVGARLLAALHEAVQLDVRVARALGVTATACAAAARRTASAYATAEGTVSRHVSTSSV